MKKKYPKTWKDFKGWLEISGLMSPAHWSNELRSIISQFGDLSFEMQLGVYLKYLSSLRIKRPEWLLGSTFWIYDEVIIQMAIEQAFKIREQELTTKQK